MCGAWARRAGTQLSYGIGAYGATEEVMDIRSGAEGRSRTGTGFNSQRFLRPPRLPFRHFGARTVPNYRQPNGGWSNSGPLQRLHLQPLLARQVGLGLLLKRPVASGPAEVVVASAITPGAARRLPDIDPHMANRVLGRLSTTYAEDALQNANGITSYSRPARNRLSLNELVTTARELRAIAPAARIGSRNPDSPRNG